MQKRHLKTLTAIFHRPILGTIKWREIEGLFVALGAEISEREGSRVAVVLFGEVRIFHRPHPSPDTDKGAVKSIKLWLSENGIDPETLQNQAVMQSDEQENDDEQTDN